MMSALRSPLIVASVLAMATATAQDALHKNSAAMTAKVTRMQETAAHPRPPKAEPVRTAFTDAEMNAYLQVEAPKFLPMGITDPHITAGEGGELPHKPPLISMPCGSRNNAACSTHSRS